MGVWGEVFLVVALLGKSYRSSGRSNQQLPSSLPGCCFTALGSWVELVPLLLLVQPTPCSEPFFVLLSGLHPGFESHSVLSPS